MVEKNVSTFGSMVSALSTNAKPCNFIMTVVLMQQQRKCAEYAVAETTTGLDTSSIVHLSVCLSVAVMITGKMTTDINQFFTAG